MMKLLRNFFTLGVIVNPFPYTIADGQAVDAVPVMANFNWLLTQVNANVPPLIPSFGALTPFTPLLKYGGANVGQTATSNGQYYRHGNVVFFWAEVNQTVKGASAGAATLEALPLTISNATLTNYPCLVMTLFVAVTGSSGTGTIPIATLVPNTTTLNLMSIVPGGAQTTLNDTNFPNLSSVRVVGQYFV